MEKKYINLNEQKENKIEVFKTGKDNSKRIVEINDKLVSEEEYKNQLNQSYEIQKELNCDIKKQEKGKIFIKNIFDYSEKIFLLRTEKEIKDLLRSSKIILLFENYKEKKYKKATLFISEVKVAPKLAFEVSLRAEIDDEIFSIDNYFEKSSYKSSYNLKLTKIFVVKDIKVESENWDLEKLKKDCKDFTKQFDF